jgi:hypothetical protein
MPWFIQYRAALPLTNKEIGSDLAQLKVATLSSRPFSALQALVTVLLLAGGRQARRTLTPLQIKLEEQGRR